jgi:hypothetical protein
MDNEIVLNLKKLFLLFQNPDWVNVVLTLFLIIFAWIQLSLMRRQIRADLIHKIYNEMMTWLEKHPETRKWIFALDKKLDLKKYDDLFLDDFLSFFEEIWTFSKQKLIDFDLVYDLFSDFLIKPYEFNLKELIESLREKEKSPDYYIGVEELYRKMKDYENKIKTSLK